MVFRLPSEIIVERFLPTVRAMLASELNARGMTQQQIATHLGVTQAAVSKYIGGHVAIEARFRDDRRLQETIERIADGFVRGTLDEYEALGEVLALIQKFEDRGPICDLHEEEMESLTGLGCDLCVRGVDTDVLEERQVLTSVRRAARRFAEIPDVVDYIPNVGTNIGMALPDPTDTFDVAAIPGRIHSMHGRAHIPSNPEFGASTHVARMIQIVMTEDSSRRSAINLATRAELLTAARDDGLDPLEFDASYEQRTAHLESRFDDRADPPHVIYHEGDFGIEPITYVTARTAMDAVTLVADLVDRSDPP